MAGLLDFTNQGGGLLGSILNIGQQRKLSDFARQEGDPYRSQLRQYQTNPSSYFSGPLAQALGEQANRMYSSKFGNPAGSGTAQIGVLSALLNNYNQERGLLGNLGGLSQFNQAIFPQGRAQAQAYGQPFQDLGNMAGGGMDTNQLFQLLGSGAGAMLA